jgi:ORF6N domain
MQIQAIENRMYEIRGQKIILNFDLAYFLQTDIDTLRQSVKNNIDRFP